MDEKERLFEERGHSVGHDRIRTEDKPWPCKPSSCLRLVEAPNIDQPIADCQSDQGAPGGKQNIRAGPQLLVDWEPDVPDQAGADAYQAGEQKPNGALGACDYSRLALRTTKPKR